MKLDKHKGILLFTLAVGIFFLFFYSPGKDRKKYLTDTGRIYGTFYKIVYESHDGKSLEPYLSGLLDSVDLSLSVFNENSIISRINSNDTTVMADDYFLTVFETGERVSEITEGAFDMTVAPLVNAWGFGFRNRETVTQELIDSLLLLVGYRKVHLEGRKVVKDNPRIMLDASGIAKGYSCDVVAEFLELQGIENYMVEIGGEVVARGRNEHGNPWTIGITRPLDDSTMLNTELQTIVYMEKGAMATSGNYRQYYIENGKKYSHTIDPRTGYPVQHNLLSATVIAPDCMTADAYATAFMVMGLEKSLFLANYLHGIEAYFIYTDSLQSIAEEYTSGFEIYLRAEDGN